ncbi:sterol desaturase family protein [Acidovorax sp. 1608163]|uniref:sterol desaturase family protein n=1 Tax=Acidovorax sp. 1608163 TaxID=2478662 RepID=UPI001F08B609|nr:sterol desaturase family protein [Acidovorax sp. 1608163]
MRSAAPVGLFLHSDLRAPQWRGYFVQRPEMHTVHHEIDHHAQNYGLPLWDLLFGTWTNPKERYTALGATTRGPNARRNAHF